MLAGCGHTIPITGKIQADANVSAGFNGTVDVRLPAAIDAGPIVPVIVRHGAAGAQSLRVAVVDVDGILINQNLTGVYPVGENPVAAFREKLEAAAVDPRVAAVVLRIHSPGGGVAACDLLAEELRRFRQATGKPVVAQLMDVATSGAYYLAVGCDRILALPTTITGAVGALYNHANLQDAMAQLNVRIDPVKAGDRIDMGTVIGPLSDPDRALFQQMADGFRDRFHARVATTRPGMSVRDRQTISDGRIVTASQALAIHMIDGLGYIDDAIAQAEHLARTPGTEVILLQRQGYPARSLYAIAPSTVPTSELIPFSYPGLERSKLPMFLYLWEPDPTIVKK
jgi:protease-4